MHGLNLYDYSARQYDATIGQFTSMDPLCEKYYHISPYAYCAGNPINATDPDGRDWYRNNVTHELEFKTTVDERKYDGLQYVGHTVEESGTYYSLMGQTYNLSNLKVGTQLHLDYSVTKILDNALSKYYFERKDFECDFSKLASQYLDGRDMKTFKFSYGGEEIKGKMVRYQNNGWVTLWKNGRNNHGKIGSNCLDLVGKQGFCEGATSIPEGHLIKITRGEGAYENLRMTIPEGNEVAKNLKPDYKTVKSKYNSYHLNGPRKKPRVVIVR